MAPAELVRAGAIVWVPNGGGQVEIVGDEPCLRYSEDDEAADAIASTLSNPAEESRLRDALASRTEAFSTARFVDETRKIVDTFRE